VDIQLAEMAYEMVLHINWSRNIGAQ